MITKKDLRERAHRLLVVPRDTSDPEWKREMFVLLSDIIEMTLAPEDVGPPPECDMCNDTGRTPVPGTTRTFTNVCHKCWKSAGGW